MTPFFSVIIPLYNKESHIKYTLKSVLAQTFLNFEVIIVDDGSTDKSYAIASEFEDKRIKLLKQKNQGVAITRNACIEKANGTYLALLDADDLWHPNHLEELKYQIEIFPNAGLFCNNYEVSYNNSFTKPAKFNFDYKTNCLIIDDFFRANTINVIPSSSSVAFLKAKFNNIGGYNVNLEIAEDLDLWIRFALNYRVSFSPKITMTYKLYVEKSLSKQEFYENRHRFINNYKNEEKRNSSLKLYLDINRYAIALRCKMNNQNGLYKKLKNEIDYKNLNFKQKTLLNMPASMLKTAKKVHLFLIKKKIHLSAYK